jgi:release factor glutamine methyltransferase
LITIGLTYPDFRSRTARAYDVGHYKIVLRLEPASVFPPSETTIALGEVIQRIGATSALDVGTGSGLLSIVLAKAGCPEVVAIDCNPRAIEAALANAARNDVAGCIRGEIADFRSWQTDRKFDLIVTNPPFMPMPSRAGFISPEIVTAIDGGSEGTDLILAFAERATSLLSPEGRLIIPVPHFVRFRAVRRHLSSIYQVQRIAEREIRYWLAEYDDTFLEFIRKLSGTSEIEIRGEANLLTTTLEILECTIQAAK